MDWQTYISYWLVGWMVWLTIYKTLRLILLFREVNSRLGKVTGSVMERAKYLKRHFKRQKNDSGEMLMDSVINYLKK